MKQSCEKCGVDYDDARCSTICPHEQFLPDDLIRQKDLAATLIGKVVRFNHQPDGPSYRVQSIGWDGMISLAGEELPGWFAPHLFTIARGEPS